MFSKVYFVLKNVHPILDFLTRRGKFILYFLDFHLFFYELFSAERIKKNARRPTGPKPSRAAGPHRRRPLRTSAAAAPSPARARDHPAAFAPPV